MNIILLTISLVNIAFTLDNGVAITPPQIIAPRINPCQVNQATILEQADLLLSRGLASRGYKYVLIQPSWQGSRDKLGQIQQDLNRFPSGFLNLIKKIHSKGLYIGLTTDIGSKTSCGKLGSAGYELLDAKTYASWGIDYVRIQNSQNLTGVRPRFTLLSNFIVQTERKIMISIDNQGKQGIQYWGKSVANSWRTTEDLKASWDSLIINMDKQIGLQNYSGEGGWNQAGPLLTNLPINDFIVQYSVWICLKSPLIITDPIESISQKHLKILQNPQLLQLHQDQLKKQGKLIYKQQYVRGWQQVWGSKISNNRFLLVFLNGMAQASKMEISLKNDVGITYSSYWIRDPLNQITYGSSSNDILTIEKVSSHGVEVRVINL